MKTLAASDISSDIEPTHAETAGKRKKADEEAALRQLAPGERLGHGKRIVANRRKAIRETPCLPAKFDPRVG